MQKMLSSFRASMSALRQNSTPKLSRTPIVFRSLATLRLSSGAKINQLVNNCVFCTTTGTQLQPQLSFRTRSTNKSASNSLKSSNTMWRRKCSERVAMRPLVWMPVQRQTKKLRSCTSPSKLPMPNLPSSSSRQRSTSGSPAGTTILRIVAKLASSDRA